MIVIIDFILDGEKKQYVFGDSYKIWQMQLKDFILVERIKEDQFLRVKSCKKEFPQNGLKWCLLEEFQTELDECHLGALSDMDFKEDPKKHKEIRELLRLLNKKKQQI